ncbi:MAG: EI24 domain-containing protein [Prochloraceae cyanobacterium]|nr:EI24 domain-containing protein [Prochloraceae cyanobacterium]
MAKLLGGFGLVAGATYPFRALRVFQSNPRLWKYLVIPIIINVLLAIVLYVGIALFGWEILQNLVQSVVERLDIATDSLPRWLGFLDYLIVGIGFLIQIVLIAILFVLTGFLLVQFGTLIGAPWYGKLSEQLEKVRTGKLEIVEVNIAVDIWRAIAFELKKLLLTIAIGIPLLAFNFIPVMGTIAASTGWAILTGTINCLDFFDATLERRRLRFREKLGIVFKSLPASASFSLVCLVLISVPLVNLLTVPLCVASGTLFCCDRILPKLLPPSG